MTEIVKANNAGDFLSVLPRMLGYHPTESLVLVPFRGSRSLGAMRFDLPPGGEERKSTVTMVGLALRVEEADGVLPIVYTDDNVARAEVMLEAVKAHLDTTGLILVDALYVAEDGWGSLQDPDGPRPIDTLPAPDPSLGTRYSATELPDVADDLIMDVVFELKHIEDKGYDLVEWNEGAIILGKPAGMAPSDLAMAVATFDRPSMRDVFIVQATSGRAMGELALAAQLAWEGGAEYPTTIAACMWGDGEQPDVKRLRAGLELARWAAALSDSAGAYATAAWFSWALGQSSHAEHYAKQGQGMDPEHGLCAIIRSFVDNGHLPAWAFNRGQS
jgi:hypothetical protein